MKKEKIRYNKVRKERGKIEVKEELGMGTVKQI